MYRVVITCHYEELWRYNLLTMCAGYDAEDKQLYTQSSERIHNEIFNEMVVRDATPPDGFTIGEPLVMECDDAERIRLILYVVTNTLPFDRRVESSPPFDLQMLVERDGEVIHEETYKINQWGGETIDIKLSR